MKSAWKRLGLVMGLACLGLLLNSGCGTPPDSANAEVSNRLRVYLVRHAEAFKNIKPRPEGITAQKLDSLTPKGEAQAAKAGAWLKDKGVRAVFHSPTNRTRETAGIIAGAIGVQMKDSILPALSSGTGQEGLDALAVRVLRAVEGLVEKHSGHAVVLVSHGDVCAAVNGHVAGTPVTERYSRNGVRTGSISELILTGKGWRLVQQGLEMK